MYELIRRIRPKLKRIIDHAQPVTNAQQTIDDNGPGGCKIILKNFFKEFPQIATC